MTPFKMIHILKHGRAIAPSFIDKAKAAASEMKDGDVKSELVAAIAKADIAAEDEAPAPAPAPVKPAAAKKTTGEKSDAQGG